MQNVEVWRRLGECSTGCPNAMWSLGNAIIFGYVKCVQGCRALELLQQMQEEVVLPDPTSFVGVLNAFASAAIVLRLQYLHDGNTKTDTLEVNQGRC